ncbi:MAG: transposase, partial [Chitinophagales bacterium]
MRKVFKGKFCSELKQMAKRGDIKLPYELKEKLYAKKWVVYAKRPFLGPKAVIEYLGRYTHKVAISNYRIKAIENGIVTFQWKDYKAGGE